MDCQRIPHFAGGLNKYSKERAKLYVNLKLRNRKKMKFGIKNPATVEEAMMFDAENGDTLWQDAINKVMANIRIAFEVLEEG